MTELTSEKFAQSVKRVLENPAMIAQSNWYRRIYRNEKGSSESYSNKVMVENSKQNTKYFTGIVKQILN